MLFFLLNIDVSMIKILMDIPTSLNWHCWRSAICG
uniref:Uncharacterized protein MANES_01G221900 n=1 Tax=Rhizophora mucronata TaxID=61149 RepID=A0A2P2ILM7_RHIMU